MISTHTEAMLKKEIGKWADHLLGKPVPRLHLMPTK